MREESVDGTLSPVSFKGGMDTLDNDTSGRRKVRSPHNVCCSWQRNFAEHNISIFYTIINRWMGCLFAKAFTNQQFGSQRYRVDQKKVCSQKSAMVGGF